MDDEALLVADFKSNAAAKMMDVAFGLNGMARWIATEAEREEQLERDRLRKRADYQREQERLKKQIQRDRAKTRTNGSDLPAEDRQIA